MQDFRRSTAASPARFNWRHALLVLLVAGSLGLVLTMPPIAQDGTYHDFADQRSALGASNFVNVISNIPFLVVGLAGVAWCLERRAMPARAAWLVLFAGVAMVGPGSSYYHWRPDDQTLVWDRLPMSLGFMGFFAALLADYVDDRLGRRILAPAVLAGLSSVLYWHWSGDLRFYVWVQFVPLLTVPALMALFRPAHTGQWLLFVALACYALAKVFEALDREVFIFTGELFSGHTLKHLLAAGGCLALLMMLRIRRPSDR